MAWNMDPISPSVTEALNAWKLQISAGVPLGKSLKTCASICKSSVARRAFKRAGEQIDKGVSFADILHTISDILTYPEQAILSAGWDSGKIEWSLGSIIDRREMLCETRRNIRSQMVLPWILFFAACFIAPLPYLILGLLGEKGITIDQYFRLVLTPLITVIVIFNLV